VAGIYAHKGYKVYGVVRSPEKAAKVRLTSDEIIPVIGDPNKPE